MCGDGNCIINGLHLDLKAMDKAYVSMIEEWIEAKFGEGPTKDPEINDLYKERRISKQREKIFIAHKKVHELYYGK